MAEAFFKAIKPELIWPICGRYCAPIDRCPLPCIVQIAESRGQRTGDGQIRQCSREDRKHGAMVTFGDGMAEGRCSLRPFPVAFTLEVNRFTISLGRARR